MHSPAALASADCIETSGRHIATMPSMSSRAARRSASTGTGTRDREDAVVERAGPPRQRNAMTMHVLLVGEGDLSHGSFLRRIAEGLAKHDGVTTEVRVIEEPRGMEAR